jgi:hypothetical protein
MPTRARCNYFEQLQLNKIERNHATKQTLKSVYSPELKPICSTRTIEHRKEDVELDPFRRESNVSRLVEKLDPIHFDRLECREV